MTKKIEFTYDVPVQAEQNIKEYNETMLRAFPNFKPLKSTEEHCGELALQVVNAVEQVGNNGGWFIGDGIKVTVTVEYSPECEKWKED